VLGAQDPFPGREGGFVEGDGVLVSAHLPVAPVTAPMVE
jgi:hypothetical protein